MRFSIDMDVIKGSLRTLLCGVLFCGTIGSSPASGACTSWGHLSADGELPAEFFTELLAESPTESFTESPTETLSETERDTTKRVSSDSISIVGELEEVVVTGTGTPHLLKDDPVYTEVISSRMLQNYGGSSIEDILSTLTTSFAFNEGDMGSQMQMNGLGNSYILILIDGKPLQGDNGGENDLGLIDPLNIERIEIVKGASSALYGSDAIAGVINIITKHHEEGFLFENTTRGGTYGDLRQHDGLGIKFGKVTSYTNFQLQHSDGWQNTKREDPKQTEFLITDSKNKTVNRFTNWQVAEKLTYDPSERLQLYIDGSWYWKRIYRVCGKYAQSDVYTYDLEYNNNSLAGGGSYKLNDNGLITLDINWDRHAYMHRFTDTTLTDKYVNGIYFPYFPYFPGQTELQSDQQRTMATLKGVFSLPYENRLSAGIELRFDWLKAPMRVDEKIVKDNTEAIYLQDEFSLLPFMNITAGLRLNRNEGFGYRVTPKISAMFSFGDLRLRATWSEGFKTPTPKELHYRYIRDMNGTYLYLGNSDLKAQSSNYYSLSAEYSIKGFTITAMGYFNDVKKMITLVTIPRSEAPYEYILEYDPVKVRQYKNMDSAKTYGVDITARYTYKELTVGAGYNYLNTDAELYDSDRDKLTKVVIDGMAHHKANIYATWNHRFEEQFKFGVGLYGRMSSKRYYQTNGNGKGYSIWRISTTYDIGRPTRKTTFRLEAGADNIFNYVDRTYHGLHLGTTTPGTTVYGAFTIRFNRGENLKNNYKSNSNNNYNEED